MLRSERNWATQKPQPQQVIFERDIYREIDGKDREIEGKDRDTER